jgi:hypothetical protein
VVVVEVKEIVVEEKWEKAGADVRSVTHSGRSAKLWPQFSPTFHHPPHLDSLMINPLTKSIKSKAISLHSFPKFLLRWMKGREIKIKYANGGRRVENKI